MLPSNAEKTTGNMVSLSNLKHQEEIIGTIFSRLYGLSNVTEEQSRQIEKLTGLSRNQALTIKALLLSPSAHASELARSLHLSPVTMVRILDHLEGLGFITRIRSKKDRRVVNIELTENATNIRQLFDNLST